MGVRFESLTEAYRVKKWRRMNHGWKKHFWPWSVASRCVWTDYTFSSGHSESLNRHFCSVRAHHEAWQEWWAMERLLFMEIGLIWWAQVLSQSSWEKANHLTLEAEYVSRTARAAIWLHISAVPGWNWVCHFVPTALFPFCKNKKNIGRSLLCTLQNKVILFP